ncbi:ABC transporter ATP-binding protein [Actinomyces sp.]|uniref:ABC transporter ATP-binding protein n=1 Tax=Actinomyces sp. TaxID=29317 RepID=UPI0026DCA06D|nr:ABC transporter ATP-binding protein [Actinomyces sp.]MDO4899581.1 ABC transporter ATP-binding protein [Actinomyces sp.]
MSSVSRDSSRLSGEHLRLLSEALTVEGVKYRYTPSGPWVLGGVDLSVRAGERVAVMGPSGSGKSTLLLCAAGLLRAGMGRVSLDGVDIMAASEKELTALRRDRLAFVFQDLNLVESLTAAQNVALPGLLGGRPRNDGEVAKALESVGLTGLEGRLPGRLSGGQRQRVAVARALASHPAMVFADEPTGALDVRAGRAVLEQLDLLAGAGAGLLVVTHDPRVAAWADRVVWLVDGQVSGQVTGADASQIAQRLAILQNEAEQNGTASYADQVRP